MLFDTEAAFAWGPATHVRLACDLLLRVDALPAGLAALLSKFAVDFIYGNIAADVVFVKRLSKVGTTGDLQLGRANPPDDIEFREWIRRRGSDADVAARVDIHNIDEAAIR